MTNFFLLFSFRPFNYSLLVGINLISHSIIFILSMFYSPTDSITPLSSFDYVPPYRPSSIPRNFFNWTIKALYNTTSTKEKFTPLLLPLPLVPTSNSPIHHFALPAPPRTLQDKGTATEKVSQILRLSFRSAAAVAPFSHSNCARHDSAFIATASTVAFALLNNVSSVRQSFRLNWRVITTTSGALRCAASQASQRSYVCST